MKRIAEKVALIALICVTFVFALTSVLYAADVIPHKSASENSVAIILLSVLGVIFVGLAVYLIYVNFSENIHVKRIMLFYDSESATRASGKVIGNIVNGCAKQVDNIKIKKTKIRVDDKLGLVATVHVETSAKHVGTAIPQLRSLLVTSFKDTLGLKFNAINFEIDKLSKKYVPETKPVEDTEDTTTEAVEPTVIEKVATPVESTTKIDDIEVIRYDDLVDA